MDRKYIEKHNIIERFILNQLTEKELDDFLFYQLTHPEIKQEIIETRHLILAIRGFKPKASTEPAKKFSKKNLLLIAALILIGSFGIWWFFIYPKAKPQQQSDSPALPFDALDNLDSNKILKDTIIAPLPEAKPPAFKSLEPKPKLD